MEKIPVTAAKIDKVIDLNKAAKKRLAKTFLNYSGILISVFLMLVVILVVTTDIKLEIGNLANLGMDFFLLLFCSYAAYVLCADTGAKGGLLTDSYTSIRNEFEEWHEKITAHNIHCCLGDFCAEYIREDLRNARLNHLVLVGITYEEYEAKYLKMTNAEIDALTVFSESQKKALKSANAVRPITLRPDQILGRVHGASSRAPLSVEPRVRRRRSFLVKFVAISVISFGMVLIGLDSIETSGWLVFVSICLKVGSVLYNCFDGYKTGYENITVYSVDYMHQQVSLMKQASLYADAHKGDRYENQDIRVDTSGSGQDNLVG